MYSTLLIAAGGAIGSLARYRLSAWIFSRTGKTHFPAGIFMLNVLACALIGLLAGLAVRTNLFSGDVHAFLFSGIVAGFGTFSAFGLETFYLIRREEYLLATGYAVLTMICGLFGILAGFSYSR